MSPDSVARFFPARAGLFDLVVFDEASQIRVADAVGAHGPRAVRWSSSGDSKQMPPTSFAGAVDRRRGRRRADFRDVGRGRGVDPHRVRAGAGAAAVAVVALPQPGRVADRVQQPPVLREPAVVVPGAAHGAVAEPTATASRWCGSTGTFHAVRATGGCCAPTRSRPRRSSPRSGAGSTASPDESPSIGVVTFNAQQRALIETLLRDAGDERLAEALDAAATGCSSRTSRTCRATSATSSSSRPASAPTTKGVLPLNFGPLNRAGGERRLNVAITRARRQVIVFSSFDPEQLRAEETSSVGIKHLRAYLDMAA